VKVMNLREGDEVSAVALVVETEADAAADAGDGALAEGDVDGVVAAEPTVDGAGEIIASEDEPAEE
jgi:hypothetical protein